MNPFSPEIVLVQNHGLGQWLKLEVAQRCGIAANMAADLPGSFISELYHQLLNSPVEKESGYSREILTWHIMSILYSESNSEDQDEIFLPLTRYLRGEGDAALRLFQLSHQLAGLYEQYLIYRPEWIYAWDLDSPGPKICQSQPWQGQLWQRISKRVNERHRAKLHIELLAALSSLTPLQSDSLPKRISLFGFSSLPPMHLDTFRVLAQKIQVDIYFLNPCQHYWGDIVSTKDVARKSIRELIAATREEKLSQGHGTPQGTATIETLIDEDYLEIGNPLLSSMGKQGREFFELLLTEESLTDETYFQRTERNNWLAQLKNDVLDLEMGTPPDLDNDTNPGQPPLPAIDRSISIHACHSKAREVEVLLDQIHGFFEGNPDLKPNDIIVMMPDVTEYISHIQNIFTDKFYYTLADQPSAEYASIINLQISLLSLPYSRLTSVEVIDLLSHPAITRKFDLSPEDHAKIRRWITDAAIRWEMDGESKNKNWGVPANNANTWKSGLSRLLQGIAMESESGLWQGNLSVDVDPDEFRCLGILARFIALIEQYRKHFSKSWHAHEWVELINKMNESFFDPSEPDLFAVDSITVAAQTLAAHTLAANYEQPLSPRLLIHWLKNQLEQAPGNHSFMRGGITFATMVPMRSIPFKVVCLLGMNDQSYPREDQSYGFDLMTLDGLKRGDRSRRNDDRYLFLEAILSAQDQLHISYEGRGIKDNKEKAPSVLVGELLDYLQQVTDHNFVIEHPLQPYSAKYYSEDYPELQSYNRHWFLALKNDSPGLSFTHQPLDVAEESVPTDISQLYNLLANPAQYYFQQRLGVRFINEEDPLLETESFVQGNLARYQLAEQALKQLIHGESLQNWQQEMVASGQVMSGPVGQLQINSAIKKAEVIFHNLKLEGEAIEYAGTISFGDFELSGLVSNGYQQEIWNFRTGQLKKRQLIKAWIEQLFASALGNQIPTRLIATKPQGQEIKVDNSIISSIDPSLAHGYLADIVKLHQLGLSKPLPFLPELSAQWFESTKKQETRLASVKKIANSWNQGLPGAESQDPYYRRLFDFPDDLDEEFETLASAIYTPLMDSWSKI